jgi:hypothetical protein
MMSRLPRHCCPVGGAFNPVDFQQRLLCVKVGRTQHEHMNTLHLIGLVPIGDIGDISLSEPGCFCNRAHCKATAHRYSIESFPAEVCERE